MISPRARRLALLLALLVGILTPLAVAAAPDGGPKTYTVRDGDTVSSIAARLDVPGGWDALFAANRDAIGPDPDRLRVGTELTIPTAPPTPAVPTDDGNYTVRAGDTLSTIASDLGVRGGRSELYRANRQRIGKDADRLEVGMQLVVPGATAPLSSTAPSGSTAPTGSSAIPPAAAPSQPATGGSASADRTAPAGDGTPAGKDRTLAVAAAAETGDDASPWARPLVVVAALLVLLLLLVVLRRRRARRISSAPVYPTSGPAGATLRPSGRDDTGEVRLVDNTTPLTRPSSVDAGRDDRVHAGS